MGTVIEFWLFILFMVTTNIVILRLALPSLVERYLARRAAEPREQDGTGEGATNVGPPTPPSPTKHESPAPDSAAPPTIGVEPTKEIVLFEQGGVPDVVVPVERPPTTSLRSVRGPVVDVLLTKGIVEVGRSPECDVQVEAATASRHHFTLFYEGGRWYLSSRETGNGTFVNGMSAAPGVKVGLDSGDRIGIGREVVLVLQTPQTTVEDLVLSCGAASHRGDRERNEDNHYTSNGFIAVADGVGGRPDGAIASQFAVEMAASARDRLTPAQMVVVIDGAIKHSGGGDSMATTFDGAQLWRADGRYLMRGAHIGDGYAFLDNGRTVRALTVPHTLVVHAAEHARLLRALGLPQPAKADEWEEVAVLGHRYVLTTDGLIDSLRLEGFQQAVERLRDEDPESAAEQLVELGLRSPAASRGLIDNLTVVVADIGKETATKSPSTRSRVEQVPLLGR